MFEGIREVEAIYGDEKAVRRRIDQGYNLLMTHFQQPGDPKKEDGVVVYVVGRTVAAKEARATEMAKKKEQRQAGKGKKTTAKKTTAKKTTAKPKA